MNPFRPLAFVFSLPLDERTLPRALHEAGYVTAICGKWHLGHVEPAYLPTHRGFDHQYGHYNGAIDYYTHIRDGGFDWHRDDRACHDEGYSTQLLAREASRLIAEHDPVRPLFLYVPFNAVHAPYQQAPDKYSAPYSHLKGDRRIYAGMVAAEDEAIGQIIAALENKGLRQNSLIVFCSDNGGPDPGVITSNGPLREGKGTLYEGGVRVPSLAVWDGKIKPGSVVNAPLHMVDWYPTLLKLAGVSLAQVHPLDGRDAWPTITQGGASPHEDILHNVTPSSGALRAGDWKLVVNGHRREGESGGQRGAKKAAKRTEPNARIELFNLATDPYEKTNLADQHPAKVEELRARLDAYARAAYPLRSEAAAPGFKVPKVWGEKD